MNVLVVYAHPNPESFNAAISQEVCNTLREAGHSLQALDLYKEGFDASMSRDERERYMSPENTQGLEEHVEKLKWAEALVFVYPTWWMGPPAILKGWLDRVWLPGVVCKIGPNGIEAALTNVDKVVVITTQGSSRFRMAVIGNPPRKMFRLSMRAVTRYKSFDWLAMYSMDKASHEGRTRFLEKVRKQMQKL